jgi:hypothetical protein
MEGVQTVDVSWLHHSQKGQSPALLGVRRAARGYTLGGGTQRLAWDVGQQLICHL